MSKLLIFVILLGLFACATPKEQMQPENSMQESTEKMVIYQVFTRLFGNTNATNKPYGTIEENGVGKMDDFTDKALSQIKSLGITHIWYTGIIEHALLTDYREYNIHLDDADVVKGRAGSPYAIKDYYDINPDLATDVNERMSEFESLVDRTHNNGMKVIIDFVPNHVARFYQSDVRPDGVTDLGEKDDSSVSFSQQNNFYYIVGEAFQVPANYEALGHLKHATKDTFYSEKPAKATGNDVFSATPSVDDWFETVKLNYGVDYLNNRNTYFDPVPDTWVKMLEILTFWANKGVDGFRCDMAEMVPVEFWEWVIPQIKEINPEIAFIAEVYNPQQYRNYIERGKFDYLYDKVDLYDTLKSIIQNRATTDDITQIWQRQEGIAPNMLRFLENHDEQRLASPYFAGKAENGIPAMVLSATMQTGPVMIYFGQEVGEPGAGVAGFSGEDGRTTIFDYWGVPEHQKWVNDGKYDGGKLSPEQRELRKFYQFVLTMCNKYPAIAKGDFFDLQYFNRSDEFTGYSNKVYAYLRHHENDRLLIVLNFNTNHGETAKVKIPAHALNLMGLEGIPNLKFENIVTGEFRQIKSAAMSNPNSNTALHISLRPNDYSIFKIN